MLTIKDLKLELCTNEILLREAMDEGRFLRAFELKIQKDHLEKELNRLLLIEKDQKIKSLAELVIVGGVPMTQMKSINSDKGTITLYRVKDNIYKIHFVDTQGGETLSPPLKSYQFASMWFDISYNCVTSPQVETVNFINKKVG